MWEHVQGICWTYKHFFQNLAGENQGRKLLQASAQSTGIYSELRHILFWDIHRGYKAWIIDFFVQHCLNLFLWGSNDRKLLPNPASKPPICLQSGKWSASPHWEHIKAGSRAFPSQANLKLRHSWTWPPHGGSKCDAASKHLVLADHEICILIYHSEFLFSLYPYPETHICLSLLPTHFENTKWKPHWLRCSEKRLTLWPGQVEHWATGTDFWTCPNVSVWCPIYFFPKAKICSHFL